MRFTRVTRTGTLLLASSAVILSATTTPASGAVVSSEVSTGRSTSVLSQPVRFVDVDGARLGYRVGGHGRPLVLIAGSSNTMAEWDPRMLDELARTQRVIVFDNRGAGTSTGSVTHLTISLMARDTASLIARLTHGSADVLGWSMGGYIAQKLAIQHPDRVRRLILASTNCGGVRAIPPRPWALAVLTSPESTQAQRMSVLFPPSRLGAGAAWAAAVGAAYAADGYQPQNAFEVSPATAAAQIKAAGDLWLSATGGTCNRLGAIRAPTLIGAGRDDVIAPVRNVKALAAGIPEATARTYRNAGHAFLFQPGLAFTRTMTEFLLAG